MALKKKTAKQTEPQPVQKKATSKRVLAIDLGATLKKGDELTDEQLANLLGAGFTEERLFGK